MKDKVAATAPTPEVPVAVFDEAGYVRTNADVAAAVRQGEYRSGYHHYISTGFQSGRTAGGMPREARNQVLPIAIPGLPGEAASASLANAMDAFLISPGGVLLIGWVDDVASPIDSIRIMNSQWRLVIDGPSLMRVRRPDVEALRHRPGHQALGYVAFVATDKPVPPGPCVVEIWLSNGHARSGPSTPVRIDDAQMRDTLLAYVAGAQWAGTAAVAAMVALDAGMGAQVVKLNAAMTAAMKAGLYVARFGAKRRVPQGSIMVCLYGKAEFLFLQNCLFAGLPSIAEYEFIFVCNSPDMAETLLTEAAAASLIYGLELTVVILPGNAGFGAANNVAAGLARGMRLLMINPDVFPKDRAWAAKHTSLIGSVRAEHCRLFGVPLYYDNGSLMHAGMYFEVDRGLSQAGGGLRGAPLVRVEHYGKGAPADATDLLRPRPVPAVTGAFMSIDRAWFEELGGFTEAYVFGHYEDADLCLKSWERGTAPWLHDIPMWHLEGKGSTRLPAHEGGALVNRWLMGKTWLSFIENGLVGPAPARLPAATLPSAQAERRPPQRRAMR